MIPRRRVNVLMTRQSSISSHEGCADDDVIEYCGRADATLPLMPKKAVSMPCAHGGEAACESRYLL